MSGQEDTGGTRSVGYHGGSVETVISVDEVNRQAAAIAEAGDAGDADTEDLFVEVSRDIDKNLWLVEAHAQAQR